MEMSPDNLENAQSKLDSETEEVNKIKDTLAGYGEKIIHAIAKDPGSFYLFTPWGSGDVLAIAAHLSHIRNRYPGFKKFFLVCRKNCCDVADMYDTVDGSIPVSVEECECITLASTMHHVNTGSNFIVGDLGAIFHADCKSRIDPFKEYVLQIPPDTKPDPVSIHFWDPYNADLAEKWKDVVILAPYAVAYPLLSENIWTVIADIAKKRGYRVYTNVYGEEAVIPGTEALRVSVRDACQLTPYVAGLISYRSGFSDIMGTNPELPHIVIYANEKSFQREKVTDLYPSEKVRNLLLDQDLFQETANAIDSLFHRLS